MYIISFNISTKNTNNILNEIPYLLVNEELNPIIIKIRDLVRTEFLSIADDYRISSTTLVINMTTLSLNDNKMHFFKVNASGIRELKDAILERSYGY